MKPYWESADGGIQIFNGDFRDYPWPQEEFDMVLTDPPYGTQWESSTGGKRTTIANDGEDNMSMVRSAIFHSAFSLKDGAVALLFSTGSRPRILAKWLLAMEDVLHSVELLIWEKPGFGMGARHRRMYETILIGAAGGESMKWFGGHDKGNVIHHPRVLPKKDGGHPSPKPVPLVEMLMSWHTRPGELVMDPFMGEGSTLVAAARSGRRAIGIEIEERWCERAVKRLLSEEALPVAQINPLQTNLSLEMADAS